MMGCLMFTFIAVHLTMTRTHLPHYSKSKFNLYDRVSTVQTGNEKVDQRWNLKNLSRGLNLPKPGLN